MKKLLFTVAAFSFVAFSYAQKKADELGKFKSETIDMGKLQQGTPTTAIFTVANIGNTPLIVILFISSAPANFTVRRFSK